MRQIHVTFLNGKDVARLALTNDEILNAVEDALRAQGNRQTVIEPRVHLVPENSAKGHFNVLRGVVKPLGLAGVKIVGDFVDNFERGLPSEMDVLALFDRDTGMDQVVVDDWGQCRKGLPFGALRQHVDSDRLTEETLHAELGQIVAGLRLGRLGSDRSYAFSGKSRGRRLSAPPSRPHPEIDFRCCTIDNFARAARLDQASKEGHSDDATDRSKRPRRGRDRRHS